MRRAAERINVSPSAVNRQIRNLEQQLGIPLFERQPRGVKLTEAGKFVLDSIRRFNQDAVLTMARIDDLRGLKRGHVAFGTLLSLAEELVPNLLSQLRSEYADVSYSHFAGNSEDIVRQIVDGLLDIGLCWDPAKSTPVHRAAVIELRVGILVSPEHPLARRKEVTLRDCLDQPCIFPARGSEIRYLIERTNVGIGATLSPAIETNSIQVAKELAAAGHGLALLPSLSAAKEIRSGKLVHRPFSDSWAHSVKLSLIFHKGRTLPPVAKMLMMRLEQSVRDYIGSDDARRVDSHPVRPGAKTSRRHRRGVPSRRPFTRERRA